MYDFEYQNPASLSGATDAFTVADDGLYLAGGQTIITVMKQRLAMPSDVIDLKDIPELKNIDVSEDEVSVGAMVTHASVSGNSDIKNRTPALSDLAGKIGDPHVRNRGTLGGSIANNDPAADYPAAAVGLGATVHTNKRQIAGDNFFTDLFETALDEGELITKVTFPVPISAAYMKISNPASRFAIVGVFVARFSNCVRIAVTGAAPCVFRLTDAEQLLQNKFSASALESLTISSDGLNSDMHGSAEYRANLIGVATRRAVDLASGGSGI
jgi:carbon-monoxide dehydrogenase medium subunit